MAQIIGRKPTIKTAAEMDKIRADHAEYLRKNPVDIKPEASEHKDLIYITIGRYTKGPFIGGLVVSQMIVEDEKGKPLKKPVRKIIAEGVDMVVAISAVETAIRKRVYR